MNCPYCLSGAAYQVIDDHTKHVKCRFCRGHWKMLRQPSVVRCLSCGEVKYKGRADMKYCSERCRNKAVEQRRVRVRTNGGCGVDGDTPLNEHPHGAGDAEPQKVLMLGPLSRPEVGSEPTDRHQLGHVAFDGSGTINVDWTVTPKDVKRVWFTPVLPKRDAL